LSLRGWRTEKGGANRDEYPSFFSTGKINDA
jgi:hypothetical protein